MKATTWMFTGRSGNQNLRDVHSDVTRFKEFDRAGCHITIRSGDLAVERDEDASPDPWSPCESKYGSPLIS